MPTFSECGKVMQGQMAHARRVCVIGAGASGLTACAEAVRSGFELVCFEQDDDLGGLWRYTPHEAWSSVARTTVINTSKEMTSLSDFMTPEDFPQFMHHSRIFQYLCAYADKFGLRHHIRFNTKVVSVTRAPEDVVAKLRLPGDEDLTVPVWAVTFVQLTESKESEERRRKLATEVAEGDASWRPPKKEFIESAPRTEYFHTLVIAAGHHWRPRLVENEYPGQATFRGTQRHSHSYKDHRPFVDRNVLVVGIGNSGARARARIVAAHKRAASRSLTMAHPLSRAGADTAVELSRHAKQVVLSTRSGAFVLPRLFFGKPLDHMGSVRALSVVPPTLLGGALEALMNLANGSMKSFGLQTNVRACVRARMRGLISSHIRRLTQFHAYQAHPTVNGELLGRIRTGSILVRRGIVRFTEGGAVFEDAPKEEVPLDDVIWCTGYKMDFAFIKEEAVAQYLRADDNRINLFKLVFPPDPALRNMAFVGYIQPIVRETRSTPRLAPPPPPCSQLAAQGAIHPIAEQQSRWVMEVQKGTVRLPSAKAMAADVDARTRALLSRYVHRARHTVQVDYLPYMDELAEQFGVKPTLGRLLRLAWRDPVAAYLVRSAEACAAAYLAHPPARVGFVCADFQPRVSPLGSGMRPEGGEQQPALPLPHRHRHRGHAAASPPGLLQGSARPGAAFRRGLFRRAGPLASLPLTMRRSRRSRLEGIKKLARSSRAAWRLRAAALSIWTTAPGRRLCSTRARQRRMCAAWFARCARAASNAHVACR